LSTTFLEADMGQRAMITGIGGREPQVDPE
jgi:hypothetical protein